MFPVVSRSDAHFECIPGVSCAQSGAQIKSRALKIGCHKIKFCPCLFKNKRFTLVMLKRYRYLNVEIEIWFLHLTEN